mmetsp:Transcript_37203/g.112496  ORF Transcript_37203/g.112496 Transcript_37203/m.112496 type:complete len:447 (+) Transcript_37203:574-1914(+)
MSPMAMGLSWEKSHSAQPRSTGAAPGAPPHASRIATQAWPPPRLGCPTVATLGTPTSSPNARRDLTAWGTARARILFHSFSGFNRFPDRPRIVVNARVCHAFLAVSSSMKLSRALRCAFMQHSTALALHGPTHSHFQNSAHHCAFHQDRSEVSPSAGLHVIGLGLYASLDTVLVWLALQNVAKEAMDRLHTGGTLNSLTGDVDSGGGAASGSSVGATGGSPSDSACPAGLQPASCHSASGTECLGTCTATVLICPCFFPPLCFSGRPHWSTTTSSTSAIAGRKSPSPQPCAAELPSAHGPPWRIQTQPRLSWNTPTPAPVPSAADAGVLEDAFWHWLSHELAKKPVLHAKANVRLGISAHAWQFPCSSKNTRGWRPPFCCVWHSQHLEFTLFLRCDPLWRTNLVTFCDFCVRVFPLYSVATWQPSLSECHWPNSVLALRFQNLPQV